MSFLYKTYPLVNLFGIPGKTARAGKPSTIDLLVKVAYIEKDRLNAGQLV
jgi:hypothetical protein